MAYNSNKPKVTYSANPGQTVFSYVFKLFVDANMAVYLTPKATGTTRLLVLGTEYTVTILGDHGGSVTLLTPPMGGDIIVMQPELSLDRLVEYQTNGDLLANTLNSDQDYQTYLIADLATQGTSAITAPPGVPGFDGQLPTPIPEAYLRWSIDGNSLTNDLLPPTWASLVPAPLFPSQEGLALVARAAGGNKWEKILGLPQENGNAYKTVTTKGVEGDSYWSPLVSSPDVISADFALEVGQNASIVSPTINDGITITIPDGSKLVIL